MTLNLKNGNNNIASKSAVESNTKYVTKYAYNEAGLLTKVTDQSGTITYSYDKYNRLTGKTDARGNKLTYTYDDTGRLSSFDNGFGKTLYEYDLLDRVTRVVDRSGEATVYEYDEVGNRTAVKYVNGVTMSYTYNPCHRLKEEWVTDGEGNTISKYVYTLGRTGECTAIKETDVLGKETTVTGDVSVLADEQLEEVEIVEGKTAYTYNALNQLLSETSSEGEINYTYDEKTTHGVSVHVNADKVSPFGGAYKIDEIPEQLLTIQRGRDSGHFEIVPNEPMAIEYFQQLLNQIKVSKV